MEENLIRKCQKNSREAQSKLFYLYKDKLFALCLKYCKNFDEAEDNLQDSFLVIFKNIHRYNFKGSFEGWMKRITINKAIDRYKKDPIPKLSLREDLIEDTSVEVEKFNFSIDQILSYVQELPSQYRLVFNLYELDNYSHKEISKLLNISEGTSKSNLHRAKVLLKTKITEAVKNQKKIPVSNG